jgi:hypothetical protein
MAERDPIYTDPTYRRPIDRNAARVLQRGAQYNSEEFRNRSEQLSHTPLPLRPAVERGSGDDLTGRILGRLTVVGLSARRSTKKRAAGQRDRWVCRCVCGRYCERRAKVIMDEAQADRSQCDECNHSRKLRERGTGYWGDGAPVQTKREPA